MMYTLRFVSLLILLVLLSACTPAAPTQPSPTAVAVSQPTATTVPPTAAPAVTTTTQATPTANQQQTPAPAATATAMPALSLTPTAGTATRPTAALSDSELIVALQKMVDQRSAAIKAGDKNAYIATVDQHNNLAFRRLQNEDWDNGRSARLINGKVTKVQRTHDPDGYVKARIEFPDGRVAYWTFLQDENGQWHLTEPTQNELGTRVSKEYTHFIVQYYPYDADVIERTATLAEKAYETITTKMKREPSKKVRLILSPTFESMPGLSAREVLAYYSPDTKDALYIRSLESYLGEPTVTGISDIDYLQQTIEHEMTHLVQDNIVPIVKLPNWMSEGLAQFNCDCWYGTLPAAIASNQLFTMEQLDKAWFFERLRGNDQQASNHDIVQGYDEGRALVEYINQKYGIEKYWDLAKEFAQSQDMPQSVQKVFGIPYKDFGAQWLEWTKQTYAHQ